MKKLPDLDQITAFIAVAEELSFKRAAERLSIDPSALSRRIKDMEARLGFQLLHRTTQNVELTDAGRHFYDSNQDVVATIRETIASANRISKGSVGHLRIGYMTFAGLHLLPAGLTRFRERFPEISISLSYQPTQEQKVALVRAEIDVGIMLGPFQHSELETRSLAKERLLAVIPRGHRLAEHDAITVNELSEQPIVLGTDRQWDVYRSRVEQAFSCHGVALRIDSEASDMLAMLGLVKAGHGITIVPQAMHAYCPQGLVTRPLTGCEDVIETIAVWRRSARDKVAEFISALTGT